MRTHLSHLRLRSPAVFRFFSWHSRDTIRYDTMRDHMHQFEGTTKPASTRGRNLNAWPLLHIIQYFDNICFVRFTFPASVRSLRRSAAATGSVAFSTARCRLRSTRFREISMLTPVRASRNRPLPTFSSRSSITCRVWRRGVGGQHAVGTKNIEQTLPDEALRH